VSSLVPVQKFDTNAVVTLPNVVSFLRLLTVPVFAWLIIQGNDVAALVLLIVFGATDWIDGYLARRLKQRSPLGAKLDPVADRLYILAALIALVIRGIVPTYFLVILVARDVMLALLVPALKRHGMVALPVNWVGKAGTMLLLMAFPLILVGSPDSLGWPWAYWVGWAFGWAGAAAYWVAGLLYLRETIRLGKQAA